MRVREGAGLHHAGSAQNAITFRRVKKKIKENIAHSKQPAGGGGDDGGDGYDDDDDVIVMITRTMTMTIAMTTSMMMMVNYRDEFKMDYAHPHS